jgi:uncharacterized membrane protein
MRNRLFFQHLWNAPAVGLRSFRGNGSIGSAIALCLVVAACSSGNEQPSSATSPVDDAAADDAAPPAASAFQICNLTASTVGVAIGYPDGDDMVTEGWWTLPPPRGDAQSCVTPDALAGPLQDRYYYVYAVDYTLGGEWAGDTYMCTSDQAFTIRGVEDCVARGYDRTGFVEVDTGGRSVHIVQLTDQQGVSAR